MADYCVMVFQPNVSWVHIAGPFMDQDDARRWIAEWKNGRIWRESTRYEIRILQKLEGKNEKVSR